MAVIDAYGLMDFWSHTPPIRDLVKIIVEALAGPLPSPPGVEEPSAEELFPPDVEA